MVMHARKISRLNDGFVPQMGYDEVYVRGGSSPTSGGAAATGKSYLRRSVSPDSRSSQSPRHSSAALAGGGGGSSGQYQHHHRGGDRVNGRSGDHYHHQHHRSSDYHRTGSSSVVDFHRSGGDRNRGSENSPHERDRYRDRDRDRDRSDLRAADQDRNDQDLSAASSSDRNRSDRDHPAESRRGGGSVDDRLSRVGAWTEHVSSSGKKYYYNSATEVSQWDKPSEWLDVERQRRDDGAVPGESASALSSASSASSLALHQRSQAPRSASSAAGSSDYTATSAYSSNGGAAPDSSAGHDAVQDSHRSGALRQHNTTSSGGGSKRHRWHSGGSGSHRLAPHRRHNGQQQEISSGDSTPTEEAAGEAGACGTDLSRHHLTPVCLSAALPRLVQPAAMSALCTPVVVPAAAAARLLEDDRAAGGQLLPSSVPVGVGSSDMLTASGPGGQSAISVHQQQSAAVRCGSGGGSSMSGLSTASVLRTGSQLTATHAQYYRDLLVQHVHHWPATQMEKQASRVNEEAHHVASLLMTKAATDLKMARSLVRLADIQATLQEQRILFLRQQIQELNDMKPQDAFLPSTT